MTSGPQALLLTRLLAPCAIKNRMDRTNLWGAQEQYRYDIIGSGRGNGNVQWSKVDRQLSTPGTVRKKRQAKSLFWKVNGNEENT